MGSKSAKYLLFIAKPSDNRKVRSGYHNLVDALVGTAPPDRDLRQTDGGRGVQHQTLHLTGLSMFLAFTAQLPRA